MNNYQKIGLISGQVFMGLGFGIAGALIVAILTTLYFELRGTYLDLFPQVLSAVIGGYIGMQAGIGYDGYKYLRQNGKQANFIRFFLQSLLGLTLGLLTFYYLILPFGNRMNASIGNVLAIALPLTGAIVGFDLGLIKRVKDSQAKDG